MSGAHTSSPERRSHADDVELVPQQSASVVQRAPSGTHALEHARLEVAGTHSPPQHPRLTLHEVPSPSQATTSSQRVTPPLAGSIVHVSASCAQHCGSPSQTSPLAPQPAFAQRPTPLPSGTHEPEQQSAPVSQSSQSGEHPPSGAQRLGPSFDTTQWREQQSLSALQRSSTTRAQPLPSPALQAIAGAQR